MPIITITMWPGRTQEQKKELAKAITENMAKIANANPDTIQIIFEEVDKKNWSIGGKIPE